MVEKSPKVRITVAAIEKVGTPGTGRISIRDTDAKGLQLRVTSNGAKSWYWVGRARGNTQYVKLGDFPTMPIARARTEATRINADVAEGKRPETRAVQASAELTLIALHRWYIENISRPHRASWKRDERKLERYWDDYRHFRLSEITKADVTRQHVKLGKDRGKVAANDALKFLSSLYWSALRNLDWQGVNPTVGVKRFDEKSRARFLSPDEIKRFFEAVKTLANKDAQDIFVLCLLTGARRHNVASMRWDQLNESEMVWTVPAMNSKNRKDLTVILVPEALQIIKARANVSPFVFYSKRAKLGHYTWPKNSWKLLCTAAGFKDVKIHDLRRTFATYQAGQNVSLHTIAKTLGHGSVEATKIYARHQIDDIRKAVAIGTQTILKHRDSDTPVKT